MLPTLTILLAAAEDVLVSRCDDPGEWRVYLGWEFPGARGRLEGVNDPRRGRCLALSFRFAAEGRYVGLLWEGRIERAKALRFWVKFEAPNRGLVRLRDSTGQEHLTGFEVEPGKWTLVEIPITPERFPAHWGGADDGSFHFPLTAILIGASRGPDEGRLLLDDVSVLVRDPPPSMRWRLSIVSEAPGGVAFVGERATCEVRLLNRLRGRGGRAALEVTARSVHGEALSKRFAVGVEGWEEFAAEILLPATKPGYWALDAVAVEGGRAVAKATSGLAVVERPPSYGRPDPECFFGLQWVFDFEAAERIGCKAVRVGVPWRWTEPRRGLFYWEGSDEAVAEARKHGMEVLLLLSAVPPDWAAWRLWERRPLKRKIADDRPAPEHLPDWREFAKAAASRYRGRIAAIEMENEPDLTCWVHPKMSFEEGADYYVRLLKFGAEGARAADPKLTIAGVDVSGGDFRGGLKFTRAVLERAAGLFDLFTGHPYASPRYFGRGRRPKWPEESGLDRKCRAALDLLASFGKQRRMWIGELGWALDTGARPLSPESLDFAACVARALVLAKSVKGVEKFLWFTMVGCNEGGFEYGLFRGRPPYPLPAACTYATCARMLHHARPRGRLPLPEPLRCFKFESGEHRRLVFVLWSKEGEISLRLPLPDGAIAVDAFGREIDGGPEVRVGALPLYIAVPPDKGREVERLIEAAARASLRGRLTEKQGGR